MIDNQYHAPVQSGRGDAVTEFAKSSKGEQSLGAIKDCAIKVEDECFECLVDRT